MNKLKLFLSLFLFVFVFSTFTFLIQENWFWIDDLGVILNGLIKSWEDIFRVFSDDMRNYATTYNYNFPKPNIISALFRPMQNIFFSIIYYFFGLNAYAFYVFQTILHSLSAALVFLLFSYFISIPLAFFGGLFYAFYPGVLWMHWICTAQHFLSLLFFLLSANLFMAWRNKQKSNSLYALAGISFLASLLSRETFAFHAIWLFFLIYFLDRKQNLFLAKIKNSISKTWIFFAATIIYFYMRFKAFGIGSLGRTIKNKIIDLPLLNKIPFLSNFESPTTQAIQQSVESIQTKPSITKIETLATNSITILEKIKSVFFYWASVIFNTNNHNKIILISGLLILFFFFAYKGKRKIMLLLLLGILFFIWPCIITYPAQRYLHSAYPFFIFMILLGINYLIKNKTHKLINIPILISIFILVAHMFTSSFSANIRGLLNTNHSKEKTIHYKFFQENNFEKGAHFIVISTPEEADLEQIFQACANDFSIKLAHVTISKLAQAGSLQCLGNYKIRGIESKVEPIHNGFRFISKDPQCAWFFHHYQPVRWSPEERAYVKHPEPYKENIWYDFSMGKFMIHKIVDNLYATDASFAFDKKWFNNNTVFVHWDTIEGKYKVLNSSHLKN